MITIDEIKEIIDQRSDAISIITDISYSIFKNN
jgi:hypothetical protein